MSANTAKMNRYFRAKAEKTEVIKGILDWFVQIYNEAVKPILFLH